MATPPGDSLERLMDVVYEACVGLWSSQAGVLTKLFQKSDQACQHRGYSHTRIRLLLNARPRSTKNME